MNYKITSPLDIVKCEINLPGSKSISNRVLMINAILGDSIDISNLSDCDDTQILQDSLQKKPAFIDVDGGGTPFRFLTSYLSTLNDRVFILTGSKRMQKRPIRGLVDSLRILGADISYLEKEGYAPIRITGKNILGGKVIVQTNITSQYLSSLLLIAPLMDRGLEIVCETEIVSNSYIDMTIEIMKYFGVNVCKKNRSYLVEKCQKYIKRDYFVESDWSAAAYWYQIVALLQKGKFRFRGLFENSIQGDSLVRFIYERFSVRSIFYNNYLEIEYFESKSNFSVLDLTDNPDLYPSIRCTMAGLGLNFPITGVDHLIYKESDRLQSVSNELSRLAEEVVGFEVNTYKDHRIAMSFAPLCIKYGCIVINDALVVSKSYPNFWNDLKLAGFKISEISRLNN
ncbi:MAG: 3-phosphoshikimate 1-carboxyvinyltransferase [Flavobacteriales bacterium]|nr:3-phosphoshikimate 1-carboxyvinyltransferase [Flavobacteriales bacterium]|tara:strand:+ start:1053 stop:2246 length:1194 start_codon:yes stop_codon:yes gene_type:complete